MTPTSWNAFRRDERGGVAIMAAVFGLLLCGLAALAVDVGSIVLTSRKIQNTADLAAMSGARDLARAQAAAQATASANLPNITLLTVQRGRYTPDPAITPTARFKAQSTEINAARVEITAPANLFFGRVITGSNHWQITRTATAAVPDATPRTMFSIGSRLASLNQGIVNALLSGLLGTNVTVNLAAYNGLADVNVNLLEFTDLLATELGVKAGDYDALLKHDVEAGTLLNVLKAVAGSNNSALNTITSASLKTKIKLRDLIGVEATAMEGLASHLDTDISALDLLMATLQTANGQRQIQLDLGVQAGLATVKAYIAIGERKNKSPWLTITDRGSPIISTAQARVYLEVKTLAEIKELAALEFPVLIQVANAQARLDQLSCSPSISTTLEVVTGAASVTLGKVDKTKLKDFTTPLLPAETDILYAIGGLVRVSTITHINVGDESWQKVTFTKADVDQNKIKSVRSQAFVAGTLNSLLKSLKLNLHVGNLGLLSGLLQPIINGLINTIGVMLTPIGPVLDGVLQPLLDLLGLKLGEADVQVHTIECGQGGKAPRLVG